MPFNFKKNKEKGFTLIEIIVVTVILTTVLFFISMFALDVFENSFFTEDSLQAQQELLLTMKIMVAEIRSMSVSNVGSYPISQASSESFTFFSDVNQDGLFEQVRYFFDSGTLKKGVVQPTGSPLVYDLANEVISDVIENVVPLSPIFSYYDENFTGTEPPLSSPVNISSIRLVKIELSSDRDPLSPPEPISLFTFATIRNLRTNL